MAANMIKRCVFNALMHEQEGMYVYISLYGSIFIFALMQPTSSRLAASSTVQPAQAITIGTKDRSENTSDLFPLTFTETIDDSAKGDIFNINNFPS